MVSLASHDNICAASTKTLSSGSGIRELGSSRRSLNVLAPTRATLPDLRHDYGLNRPPTIATALQLLISYEGEDRSLGQLPGAKQKQAGVVFPQGGWRFREKNTAGSLNSPKDERFWMSPMTRVVAVETDSDFSPFFSSGCQGLCGLSALEQGEV